MTIDISHIQQLTFKWSEKRKQSTPQAEIPLCLLGC